MRREPTVTTVAGHRHTGVAMTDTGDVFKTMNLALRIGEVLLSSGAGAADVRAQMDNVARACGLRRFSVDVTFTELAMSYQTGSDEPAMIQLRQVRHREVDYGDLTLVDHLVRDLAVGAVDRDEALARLNRITSTGHPRPRWATTLGLGVMGGGIGMVIGGNLLMIAIGFVAASCIDLIQREMTKRRWPVFYQQAAGGLFATVVAALVGKVNLDLAPGRVITTSIILLLAGVSFLGAIQDALTGFPLTSGARILEAFIATAGAIAGVSGGLTFARLLGSGLGTNALGASGFAALPFVIVGGAVASSAYAYATHAPLRSLAPIAGIAGVATAVYYVSNDRNLGRTVVGGGRSPAHRAGQLHRRRPGPGAGAGHRHGGHRAAAAGPVDLPRAVAHERR